MEIRVNGESKEVQDSMTLREFLVGMRLPSLERGIAVLLNGEIVRKADWEGKILHSEDQLEIVHATQGG